MNAHQSWRDAPGRTVAEHLERGDVVHYPICPFALPAEDDLRFLLSQRLANRVHKNIGFNPASGKMTSYAKESPDQGDRLRNIFANFSAEVVRWASEVLPPYGANWQLDRVSYRPEEEATRKLRRSARNDLLHVDAFPSRPTNGWRILRVFANINPSEDRVWATSMPFAELLERYGVKAGLPSAETVGMGRRLTETFLSIFRPGQPRRSPYDAFMLRLHHWLKNDDEFQEKAPKRIWDFHPGSAWLAITDTASHSVLRGRFALEHSFFLCPDSLALPDEAPAALLQRACGKNVLHARRAA